MTEKRVQSLPDSIAEASASERVSFFTTSSRLPLAAAEENKPEVAILIARA